jgi:hypothetical protein
LNISRESFLTEKFKAQLTATGRFLLNILAVLVWSWYQSLETKTMKENKNQENGSRVDLNQSAEAPSNTVKNPDDWTTGDQEMTGAQRSYLNTLAQEAGEEVEGDLTKAEASKKIDELQNKTGRGVDH